MENTENNNKDNVINFSDYQIPDEDNQPPYENHVIPTNGSGLLSDLFNMVGETTKDIVGLTKSIANDITELGQKVFHMKDENHLSPDMPMSSEEKEAAERRTLANAQWQEILRHRAQQQDLSLDR